MQYCSLLHQTFLLSPVTSTAGCCFCFGSIPLFFLQLFLHWSPVACWSPTDWGSSRYSILSFCLSYCSWGSQGKKTEVVCHSLLQWTTFCQTSPSWPVHLGWPHRAWLRFIELNKAVVHVIRLASLLWLWFLCVFHLMPSCNTYHLTWVSLTLEEGYLLMVGPPDLERGVAPLGPPLPKQPQLLGRGVAPLGYCPWPPTWGSSSRWCFLHGPLQPQCFLQF